MTTPVPPEYRGWWRIIDTEAWVNDDLDILGPALLSLTGSADRLRMHCLLAFVNARATKTGVSFGWEGAAAMGVWPISWPGTSIADLRLGLGEGCR